MKDHKCDCMSQGPALLPVRYATGPGTAPASPADKGQWRGDKLPPALPDALF